MWLARLNSHDDNGRGPCEGKEPDEISCEETTAREKAERVYSFLISALRWLRTGRVSVPLDCVIVLACRVACTLLASVAALGIRVCGCRWARSREVLPSRSYVRTHICVLMGKSAWIYPHSPPPTLALTYLLILDTYPIHPLTIFLVSLCLPHFLLSSLISPVYPPTPPRPFTFRLSSVLKKGRFPISISDTASVSGHRRGGKGISKPFFSRTWKS